jgi:hypothetical protein
MKKFIFPFLIFTALFFCSCEIFENPQPFDIKESGSVPSDYRGEYLYTDNSKFSVKKNKIEIYEVMSVKENRDKYFKKDDVGYIVYRDSAFVIYNPSFYKDSVSGDVVMPSIYEIGKNLVIKESRNWVVFNLHITYKDGDDNSSGYTPIITTYKNDFIYLYKIEENATKKLNKNKDNFIKENISSKDIDDYLLDKRTNLGLIGIFDIKNKKVSYWKN